MNTSYSSLNKRDKTAGSGQKQNFCHDLSSHNISTAVVGRNISLVLPFFATTMTVDTHKTRWFYFPPDKAAATVGEGKNTVIATTERALSGRDLKALSVNNRLISSMIPQLQAALRELSPFDWLSRRSWATSSSQGGGRETHNTRSRLLRSTENLQSN